MNKKEIEKFLLNYLIKKEGKKVTKILYKQNLLESGIIDSLDLVTISIEIEKNFNIKLNPNSDKTLQNFIYFKDAIDYIYSIKSGK